MKFSKDFYLAEINVLFYKMVDKMESVELDKEELKDYYGIMDEIVIYLQNNINNLDYI